MASSSGMTATPFLGPTSATSAIAPDPTTAAAQQTADPSASATATAAVPDASASSPRPFDLKSIATAACRGIARTPAYAAVLFAALMYMGIKYREHLPPRHGRMIVASTFAALLYLLAVISSGDPAVATRGLAGLMGTADGTGGLSIVARVKASWFVVYPAIAVAAASVPSLRPWPLVAVVGAAIVLPGVIASKAT